jgi:hypothetical protein
MPIFLAALLGGLIQVTGSIVGRVLISLGIGFVAFSGLQVGMDALKAQAFAAIGALPPALVGLAGMMKIGTAVNIIFAALIARMLLAGMMSGTVRRMVFGVGDIRRAGG